MDDEHHCFKFSEIILLLNSSQNKSITLLPWQAKKQNSPFNSEAETSHYASCGINFKDCMMHPRWKLAVQNICTIKITNLANVWEEMETLVKN